jgi:hypothetical protein
MIDEAMMIFQNCMDLGKYVLGLCSETHQTSHGENQVSTLEAERITGIKEEKILVPVICQVINAEYEVSYMSVSVSAVKQIRESRITCCLFHLQKSSLGNGV